MIALSDLLEDTRDAVRQELDEQANKTKAEDPAQPRDCGPDEHAAQSNDDHEVLAG